MLPLADSMFIYAECKVHINTLCSSLNFTADNFNFVLKVVASDMIATRAGRIPFTLIEHIGAYQVSPIVHFLCHNILSFAPQFEVLLNADCRIQNAVHTVRSNVNSVWYTVCVVCVCYTVCGTLLVVHNVWFAYIFSPGSHWFQWFQCGHAQQEPSRGSHAQ